MNNVNYLLYLDVPINHLNCTIVSLLNRIMCLLVNTTHTEYTWTILPFSSFLSGSLERSTTHCTTSILSIWGSITYIVDTTIVSTSKIYSSEGYCENRITSCKSKCWSTSNKSCDNNLAQEAKEIQISCMYWWIFVDNNFVIWKFHLILEIDYLALEDHQNSFHNNQASRYEECINIC